MTITYQEGTDPEVLQHLENAYKNKLRIRLWYGHKGVSWEQEDAVVGFVVPREAQDGITRPYLLHNATSKEGQWIPSAHIVKLIVDKSCVYEHPKFDQPRYYVLSIAHDIDWPWWVMDRERIVKRFKTKIDAERWVDFMEGRKISTNGRKS